MVQNKVLYNRVIDSIVNHRLEECLLDKTKLEILSEVLTKLVFGNIPEPSDEDYDKMFDMLQRYTRKIIEDSRILSLVPLSEFEPPEPLSLRMKVISELEKKRREIFTVEFQCREFVDVPKNILEKIAEKIWSCKIGENINADKYYRILVWANQWSKDRRDDIIKELYEKQSKNNELRSEENGLQKHFEVKTDYHNVILRKTTNMNSYKIPNGKYS